MGAKNAKTYEDLICINQAKRSKEMVYDYDHGNKSKTKPVIWGALDDHETLLNTKVTYVSSCQKLGWNPSTWKTPQRWLFLYISIFW